MKRSFILAFSAVFCLFFACKTDKLYEEYKTLEPTGWDQDSCAVFSFKIDKTFLNYNLFVNVRNRGDYANSNLWLFVDIKAPDYTCIHDTVEYQLALPNGKWIGKGTGGMFSNQFPFRENVYFPVEGTYTISIRHAMRNNPLKGISDIGIGVKRR
jgi:gliding motility-associated lipoprotein GldH